MYIYISVSDVLKEPFYFHVSGISAQARFVFSLGLAIYHFAIRDMAYADAAILAAYNQLIRKSRT